MRGIGFVLAAIGAGILAATAGAAAPTGDSVRGSGTFTIIESTATTPFVGYDAKVAVDARSAANGEDARGRVNAVLTKTGDRQSFRVQISWPTCSTVRWSARLARCRFAPPRSAGCSPR